MSIQNLKSRKSLFGPRATRGFTLLEMAMVLAIIGLIMGTILSMTKTLSSSSKIAATQSKEALIKAALINFIAVNNRLPCPADPTATASTAGTISTTPPSTFGAETVNAATPKGCGMPLNTGVYAGVVPWATLGLTQDAAVDGYNQFFTYLVAATAIKTVPVTAITALNAGLVPTISGLEGAISIYSSSALTTQINNCTPIGSTYNPCSAVVALISHGADGYGAYTGSGAAAAFPYADEQQNALHTNKIVMHDAAMSSTTPFDDIILPMTSSDLLTSLTANGTIQTYNAVLNNNFANITSAITAYAMYHRTGTAGSYTYNFPASLASLSLPPSVTYDPWGNQISFTLSITAVSSNTINTPPPTTPPTSTVVTLLSNGPDGATPNSDDISAVITVSQFLTPFTNYGW